MEPMVGQALMVFLIVGTVALVVLTYALYRTGCWLAERRLLRRKLQRGERAVVFIVILVGMVATRLIVDVPAAVRF